MVSTSNRVVINLKCGAPTKIRQGKLVARILTHAQKHDQMVRAEVSSVAAAGRGIAIESPSQAVDFQQTFHLLGCLGRCRRLLKVRPEGLFAKYFHVAVVTT